MLKRLAAFAMSTGASLDERNRSLRVCQVLYLNIAAVERSCSRSPILCGKDKLWRNDHRDHRNHLHHHTQMAFEEAEWLCLQGRVDGPSVCNA